MSPEQWGWLFSQMGMPVGGASPTGGGTPLPAPDLPPISPEEQTTAPYLPDFTPTPSPTPSPDITPAPIASIDTTRYGYGILPNPWATPYPQLPDVGSTVFGDTSLPGAPDTGAAPDTAAAPQADTGGGIPYGTPAEGAGIPPTPFDPETVGVPAPQFVPPGQAGLYQGWQQQLPLGQQLALPTQSNALTRFIGGIPGAIGNVAQDVGSAARNVGGAISSAAQNFFGGPGYYDPGYLYSMGYTSPDPFSSSIWPGETVPGTEITDPFSSIPGANLTGLSVPLPGATVGGPGGGGVLPSEMANLFGKEWFGKQPWSPQNYASQQAWGRYQGALPGSTPTAPLSYNQYITLWNSLRRQGATGGAGGGNGFTPGGGEQSRGTPPTSSR